MIHVSGKWELFSPLPGCESTRGGLSRPGSTVSLLLRLGLLSALLGLLLPGALGLLLGGLLLAGGLLGLLLASGLLGLLLGGLLLLGASPTLASSTTSLEAFWSSRSCFRASTETAAFTWSGVSLYCSASLPTSASHSSSVTSMFSAAATASRASWVFTWRRARAWRRCGASRGHAHHLQIVVHGHALAGHAHGVLVHDLVQLGLHHAVGDVGSRLSMS